MKFRFYSLIANVTYTLGLRTVAYKYALKSTGADSSKAKPVDLIKYGLLDEDVFTTKRTR